MQVLHVLLEQTYCHVREVKCIESCFGRTCARVYCSKAMSRGYEAFGKNRMQGIGFYAGIIAPLVGRMLRGPAKTLHDSTRDVRAMIAEVGHYVLCCTALAPLTSAGHLPQ